MSNNFQSNYTCIRCLKCNFLSACTTTWLIRSCHFWLCVFTQCSSPQKNPFFSTFCWDQLAKIRQYHLKERPKITRVAKFKNDLLKANKDTCIAPQSHKILQRVKFVSLTTQAFVKFHYFAESSLPY